MNEKSLPSLKFSYIMTLAKYFVQLRLLVVVLLLIILVSSSSWAALVATIDLQNDSIHRKYCYEFLGRLTSLCIVYISLDLLRKVKTRKIR